MYGIVRGSKYLGTVEAETAEEAKEKVYNSGKAYVSLCNQCSEECEDPEIDSLDVTPL